MNHLFEILIQDTNLSATGFFILCGVSFLGSLIAGALGLGGGVLVLATMANLLSPTARRARIRRRTSLRLYGAA